MVPQLCSSAILCHKDISELMRFFTDFPSSRRVMKLVITGSIWLFTITSQYRTAAFHKNSLQELLLMTTSDLYLDIRKCNKHLQKFLRCISAVVTDDISTSMLNLLNKPIIYVKH